MQRIRRHMLFCLACLLGMFAAVSASLQTKPVDVSLGDSVAHATLLVDGMTHAMVFSHDVDHATDSGDGDDHRVSQDNVDLDEGMLLPDAFRVVLQLCLKDPPGSAHCPGFAHPSDLTPRPPRV